VNRGEVDVKKWRGLIQKGWR